MNPFRANNNWLRYRVLNQMRTKHKDLFDPLHKSFRKSCANYISESKNWYVILLGVILFFSISSFINLPFLNWLDLKAESAVYIVDQRTANIATIISITLVVVGFILNNLAVKSALVYRLLFQKSLLYPIIYLTLSTIACFIAVSTLRNELDSFVFTRCVLAGTYLFFVILFLIGFLFRSVFLFSNDKYIAQIIEDELMKEARENTKQILLKKYSSEEYSSLMEKHNAKEYDWAEAWNFGSEKIEVKEITQEEVALKQSKEKLIQDINLTRVTWYLKSKKKAEKLFFRKLNLEMSTDNAIDFIWEKEKKNNWWRKLLLRISIVLKTKPKKEKDNYEMRKYFDDKLEEYSEQGKYRNLETLLDTLEKLYEYQMLHQK